MPPPPVGSPQTTPGQRIPSTLLRPTYQLSLILLSLLLFVPTQTATASNTPSNMNNHSLFNLSLQELMQLPVTVRKRSESLQDYPGSVTSISENEIFNLNADRFSDLSRHIPNNAVGGIRGISTSSLNIAIEQPNSFFLDGVHLNPSASNIDLVDLERVEIVRGPQGTYLGDNTMSGAIQYISQKPEAENSYSLRGQLGDSDLESVKGVINQVLADKVFARLSFSQKKVDGYYKNLFNGSDANNTDDLYGRFQLRFEPREDLNINLSLDGQKTETDRILAMLRTPPNAEAAAALAFWTLGTGLNPADIPTSSYRINQDQVGHQEMKTWGANVTLDYQIDPRHSLTSISSHRKGDNDLDSDDEDMLPLPLANTPTWNNERSWAQEVRVNAEYDKTNWVAGLYYQREHRRSHNEVHADDLTLELIIPLITGGALAQPEGIDVDYRTDFERESYAVFGNLDIELADAFTGTLGLRYTYETSSVEYDQEGGCWTEPGDLIGTCFYPQIDTEDSNRDDHLSPFIALRYQPTENLTAYISFSQGYRSGGYNANLIQLGDDAAVTVIEGLSYLPNTVTGLPLAFEPEETKNYETGVKMFFPSLDVSMDASLFYTTYDDLVVSEVVGSAFDANSGKAQIRGVEWSADWRPIESLNLKSRVGYLDAKYTRFKTVAGEDFSGNRLTQSPEWNVSFQMDYRCELGRGLIGVAHGNYSYVDDYFTSANNDSALHKSPETWRIDGKLGVESKDEKWGVYLWGKNITDESKEENVGVQSIFGLARTQLTVPRSYGIELLGRF